MNCIQWTPRNFPVGSMFQWGMHINFPSCTCRSWFWGAKPDQRRRKKVEILVTESREKKIVEMISGNTQELNGSKNRDQKGKGKVVNDGYNSWNGSLESVVDNPMLASQEIQGPSTPAKTHGNSVVFEIGEGKEKEKTDQQQQTPKHKPSIHLFTTNVKPRLRWTTKLHARFVHAIHKLGGARKATPKTLQDAMALDGLDLRHVKSHLQKYRTGKLTVRDWPDVPKIRTSVSQLSTGPCIGTSTCSLPFQVYGQEKYKGFNIKKIYKAEDEVQRQLCMKLKEAEYQRPVNDLIQEAQKQLANQCNGGPGEKTMATTPFFPSILENKYTKYNTLDKIKECLGFQKQVSSFATYQSQDVAHSATGEFITSQEYPYPEYNSTDAISVHVGLQEQTASLLSQNEVYTSQPWGAVFNFQPQNAAYEFHPPNASYSASSSFPTSTGNHSETTEYLQHFQPQSASYTFQPQNASNDYQSQNAGYTFQLQNASYFNQPQTSAYGNQLQNAAYPYLPQNAAYVFQPQNEASSATNNLPTSNVNYSDTAYLDDLTAALAATGNTSLASLLDDPVDAYMTWGKPEPNAQDNGNTGPHPT